MTAFASPGVRQFRGLPEEILIHYAASTPFFEPIAIDVQSGYVTDLATSKLEAGNRNIEIMVVLIQIEIIVPNRGAIPFEIQIGYRLHFIGPIHFLPFTSTFNSAR